MNRGVCLLPNNLSNVKSTEKYWKLPVPLTFLKSCGSNHVLVLFGFSSAMNMCVSLVTCTVVFIVLL